MEKTRLLWSVKEAAVALGISPWTIRRLIRNNGLHPVRLGRRVLVEPLECQRLIAHSRANKRQGRD
jgi:excisionase family DNA binding protein